MHYFNEPAGRVKIQATSISSAILHNKTSNKRYTIQHAKLSCPCGRISQIFIYGECMTEVCEAERNLRGKFILLQPNCTEKSFRRVVSRLFLVLKLFKSSFVRPRALLGRLPLPDSLSCFRFESNASRKQRSYLPSSSIFVK